jgi:cytochrome c oxidase subunit 1
VVTGTLVALMGGLYHWFPKMFGRTMNEFWGKVHFWGTIVCMNGIFFPMFIQGMAGMQRRLYDPTVQAHNLTTQGLSPYQFAFAIGLLVFQIPFLINIFVSIFKGKLAVENPWEATTLEWACPSPPPHGNFTAQPHVHRDPYEYSVAGASKDWLRQDEPIGSAGEPA